MKTSWLTDEHWRFARKHFLDVHGMYAQLGAAGVPAIAIVFAPLMDRYNSGERTVDLYEAMTSVE